MRQAMIDSPLAGVANKSIWKLHPPHLIHGKIIFDSKEKFKIKFLQLK